MRLSISSRQVSRWEEREGERKIGEGARGQMQSMRPGTQHARTDVDTDRCVDQPILPDSLKVCTIIACLSL